MRAGWQIPCCELTIFLDVCLEWCATMLRPRFTSRPGSESYPHPGDGDSGVAPSQQAPLSRSSRGDKRRAKRDAKRAADDDRCPEVAIEVAASQAVANALGVSISQLNPTCVAPAIEQIMLAFQNYIYHFQDILKDRSQAKALVLAFGSATTSAPRPLPS